MAGIDGKNGQESPGLDADVEAVAAKNSVQWQVTPQGQAALFPRRDQYIGLLRELVECGFGTCIDLCAVDYLTHSGRSLPQGVEGERFEIVLNLLDFGNRRRLRVRVQVPEAQAILPSAFGLHPSVDAMEREAYDMFGIEFVGHPDMTRILMPEDWEGHPLRKDYGVGSVPVRFKEAGVRHGQ